MHQVERRITVSPQAIKIPIPDTFSVMTGKAHPRDSAPGHSTCADSVHTANGHYIYSVYEDDVTHVQTFPQKDRA